MRVRQATHVEDQVGVERQAVLEAEGLEQQGQAVGLVLQRDEVLDHRTQGIRPQVAGVDAMAESLQGGQRRALLGDRLGQRLVAGGERMAAARFGKALDQHVVARIEEDAANIDPVRRELLQLGRQGRDAAAAAHVDRHRDARLPLAQQVARQPGQQCRRQVVDAEVAGILQHVQRDGFSGTRQAADEHELHGSTRKRRCALW